MAWLRGLRMWEERTTPLVRFTVQLTFILLVSLVGLSLALSTLLENYFFQETDDELRQSVGFHFAFVFGTNVFTQPLPDDQMPRYDRMVRLHYDVYEIVDARFYDANLTTVFAYQPDLIGQRPDDATAVSVRQALAGRSVTRRLAAPLNASGTERGEVLEVFAPVLAQGQTVGVVLVHRNAERLLADIRRMQATLCALIAVVGLAIFLALRQIYRRSTETILQQAHRLELASKRLRASRDSALAALVAALEFRDKETEGHTQRVTHYSRVIAGTLGLDDADRAALAQGALLHDIGKIGVPDAILHKPGPLDEAEWAEMRKHPALGSSLVRRIDFFAGALPVVCHHHERWDGRGYPDGLAGEAIPLPARIFAVADAFDAMTSDRPYRRALPLAAARHEIERNAGAQFDPRVVDAFMRIPESELVRLHREAAGVAAPAGVRELAAD